MSEQERPTPEQMLAVANIEREQASRRGRLKVFFGYAAGVGKTFAMLQEARRLNESGVDVVVGYVEPHGRPETEALLDGLETLPTLSVPYRGATLREFDLDRALVRRPAVILVDELAHTNAPGLRHAKRWQDVEELLAAGIDVHTTCNVQHVESLNDVIAQVSGVVVRETIPDDVFNRADDLTLIDIPPEDLLERLREGKVYIPAQAERALRSFFQRPNLVVLRELALRRTAERVHADVETARTSKGSAGVWATRERLLVCVGPSPTSAKVVRSAKRLANSLQGELIAVHVENAATSAMSEADISRLLANLRLAENLGAEIVTVTGDDLVAATLNLAKRRNVTKIVIGKTEPSRRWFLRRATLSDRLIRDSGNIDVYVVRGAAESLPQAVIGTALPRSSPAAWWGTAAILAGCAALSLLWERFGLTEANLVMTFLFGVVIVAARYGRGPSVVASVLGVLLFDVLFTMPYYTVVVEDTQYVVTFLVMLAVGLTTAELTARIRRQAELALENERRTDALYRLNRNLAGLNDRKSIATAGERGLADLFGGEAVIFLLHTGSVQPIVDHAASFAADPSEVAVAQWVAANDRPAGQGTDTLPAAKALYLPLSTSAGRLGVLAIRHPEPSRLQIPQTRRLLETYATQIAQALERASLGEESQAARMHARTEELRSTLLASVSHDIRTPLAVIAGACSSLMEERGKVLDEAVRRDLLTTISEETDRLTRLVENLLRLTQLSSGRFHIEKEWHPVEDVIGSALHRLQHTLGVRQVRVELPDEMLQGEFDAVLIEQVLVNLLENAARYTPDDSSLEVRGGTTPGGMFLEVADHGPGLAPDELTSIFETFQRGQRAKSDSRGAGLGLSICRAIVEAHGGRITAQNRPEGGALFRVELPSTDKPPSILSELRSPELAHER